MKDISIFRNALYKEFGISMPVEFQNYVSDSDLSDIINSPDDSTIAIGCHSKLICSRCETEHNELYSLCQNDMEWFSNPKESPYLDILKLLPKEVKHMNTYIKAEDKWFFYKKLSNGKSIIMGRAIIVSLGRGLDWGEVLSTDAYPALDIELQKETVKKQYQDSMSTRFVDWNRAKTLLSTIGAICICDKCKNILNDSSPMVEDKETNGAYVFKCIECNSLVAFDYGLAPVPIKVETKMNHSRFYAIYSNKKGESND